MSRYDFESSKAFVSTFTINPYQSGKLDGLTFAVKDNIDVAGFKTSYGSKPWLDTHPPAVSHAVCVEQLLNAGACCVGKTITDEFTYSLDGESYFYGTPVNPKSPDRIPGGSSSGSASAVACGLVDFAIGTDSAGSTRVPASHCGILGMRPTLYRISDSGILPFAPSSSTVGIFANSLTVLEKAMTVLLSSDEVAFSPVKTIYLLADAWEIVDKEIKNALEESILRLRQIKNIEVTTLRLSDIVGEEIDLFICNEKAFTIPQDTEVWNAVGSWIEAFRPEMGPRARNGLEHVKQLDRSTLNEALHLKERIFTKIFQFTKVGDLFCFPTVPIIPPLKGELDVSEKAIDYYKRTMSITSFAGVGRLPEISMPVAKVGNVSIGLSFAAAYHQDEFLLAAMKQLFAEFV